MPTSLKKPLLQTAKILLGLLLLYLSLRSVDWPTFRQALLGAVPGWLLLALLSVLISLALKVCRWHILLQNYRLSVPFPHLVSAFFLGQAANILLILRSGEVLRIGMAHQTGSDDWVEITATVALEKYLDAVMLVLSMLAVSAAMPAAALASFGRYRMLIIIASLTLLLAVLLGPWIWKRCLSLRPWKGWLARVAARLDAFIDASLWLRNPAKVLPILLWSAAIWLIMALTNWLLFQSLGISPGWQAAGLVLILVYIGVLPALMPGNLGPFTYFAQIALLPFAVGTSEALAFAVLLYVLVNLPPLIMAGVMLLLPAGKQANLRKMNSNQQ